MTATRQTLFIGGKVFDGMGRMLPGHGVLVEGAEGPAVRAGLQAGDVILAVANVQIGSVKEFEAVLAKLDKSKPVSVLVRRGEWAQYAVIRPGK